MPLILIHGQGAMAICCAVVVNADGGVGSDGDYCNSVMKMLLLLIMLLLYLLFNLYQSLCHHNIIIIISSSLSLSITLR